MGNFEKQAIKIFKALADPTRYKIICLLIDKGELGCAKFNDIFAWSKSAMSNHYRILENADLIRTRKKGLHVFFSINNEVFDRYLPNFHSSHVVKENSKVP